MVNLFHGGQPGNFTFEFNYSGKGSLSRGEYALHLHDKTEILVLTGGECEFFVDGRRYSLVPGDALVINPNVLHHCVLPAGRLFEFICCWTDCDCQLLKPLSCLPSPLVRPAEGERSEILSAAEYLAFDYKEGEPLKTYSFILRLLSALSESGTGQSDPGQFSFLPESELLADILTDVNRNYAEISSVKQLAERHFISAATLGRLFSGHLRTTPGLYLETRRLAAARTFLSEGASVSEAAEKAGFSDDSNFIRLFKNRFACTPGEYKRNFQLY